MAKVPRDGPVQLAPARQSWADKSDAWLAHAVSVPMFTFVLLIRMFGMTDAFKEPSRVQSLLQSACVRTAWSLSGLSVSVPGVVIAARCGGTRA